MQQVLQQQALPLDLTASLARTWVRRPRWRPEVTLGIGVGGPLGSLNREVRELDRGEIVAACERWLVHLRDERQLSKSSIDTYRGQLRIVLGRLPLDYDYGLLREVVSRRLDPKMVSGHTRRAAFVALDQFFRWHEQEGGVVNPLRIMKPPPKPVSRRRGLSSTELELLSLRLRHAPGKDRCEILLMLVQGFRVSDVVNLHVEDVDFAQMRVRCRSGKGGRDDWLPMGPTMADALSDYLGDYGIDSGFAFTGPKGRMTAQAVWKAWRRVAGGQLQGLCPHQLRHTYATMLLRGENPTDINTVRRLMRHRNLATTQLYLDDDPGRERAAIISLDERLRRIGP